MTTLQGEQLSIFGQQSCMTAAEIEHARWIAEAKAKFLAALADGPKTVDEVITERPKDMNPNVIGSLIGQLSRAGKIVMVGVRKSDSTARRAGLNRIWMLAEDES